MNSNEIYKRFTLKINRNDSNEGANFLKGHFVLLFNAEADKLLEEKIIKEGDNVKLDRLNILLKSDILLNKVNDFDDCVEFELPSDFRRHASSFSIVDKDECKEVKIYNFDKKALGFTSILADAFSRPSFDMEETPFFISQNKMRVFFDDFKINKCFLTYYKRPEEIDIEGYIKFDNSPSTNIDSDLPNDVIEKVLDRLAVDVRRQFKDTESFQLEKERIITEP